MDLTNKLGMLLALILLSLSFAAPALGETFPDDTYIARIESGGEELWFADHSSSTTEGNWIELSGGTASRIPKLTFTYNGVNHLRYGGSDLYLNVENCSDYVLSYPYSFHKTYTDCDKVYVNFKGNDTFKNMDVDIYLANASSNSVENGIDFLVNGKIAGCNVFFDNITDSHEKVATVTLDEYGDFTELDLGTQSAGLHGIVILLNGTGNIKVLSSTAFEVLDYTVSVSAPETLEEGKDLEISMDLDDSAGAGEYTYGALLIKKSAYRADIRVECNGTRPETSIFLNGMDVIDQFGINSSNYKSNINRNELQENIPALIGEGNGAIAISSQSTLPFITEDLPDGNYILLSGVYQSGKGLVAFNQKELKIYKEKTGGGGSSPSGGGGGGGGGSPEPAKNVRVKELSQQYITNGNHANFNFPMKVTCITYVDFDPKRNLGKITTIIEELKGRSILVPELPEGKVYEYINIWVGNEGVASPDRIENAVIGFRIKKEWITENNIDIDSIVLERFSEGKWNRLTTRKVGEDSEYLYLEAKTPGFSPFAITSWNIAEPADNMGNLVSQGSFEIEVPDKSGESLSIDVEVEDAGVSTSGNSKASWLKKISNIINFILGFVLLVGTWALLNRIQQK